MKTGRILVFILAACAAALPLGGCRERPESGDPAVAAAEIATVTTAAVPAVAMERDALQVAKPSPAPCSFDSVGMQYFQGTLTVDRSQPLHLRGWLSNAEHKPAGQFRLVLSGESSAWAIPASTGALRPDVSKYYGQPALGIAGFDLMADLAQLPAGTYAIMLVFEADGGLLTCDAGKRLQLQ